MMLPRAGPGSRAVLSLMLLLIASAYRDGQAAKAKVSVDELLTSSSGGIRASEEECAEGVDSVQARGGAVPDGQGAVIQRPSQGRGRQNSGQPRQGVEKSTTKGPRLLVQYTNPLPDGGQIYRDGTVKDCRFGRDITSAILKMISPLMEDDVPEDWQPIDSQPIDQCEASLSFRFSSEAWTLEKCQEFFIERLRVALEMFKYEDVWEQVLDDDKKNQYRQAFPDLDDGEFKEFLEGYYNDLKANAGKAECVH